MAHPVSLPSRIMAVRMLWMLIQASIIRRHQLIVATPNSDPWHFPRDALAASVPQTLDSGIVNAITLFAPRRMGKTEFVRADLAPLAPRQEWMVTYGNLWSEASAIFEASGRSPYFLRQAITVSRLREVRPSHVQTVLQRLEREGFVERGMRGGYAIADPMVTIWMERVRSRAEAA